LHDQPPRSTIRTVVGDAGIQNRARIEERLAAAVKIMKFEFREE
jgi:hypothetical protein